MFLILKYLICIIVAALVSLIFYTNYRLPISTASVTEPTLQLNVNNSEWQRFLHLEQLIALTLTHRDNYVDFGLELDKIFNEAFVLDKSTWDHTINMIQRGFMENKNEILELRSILRCYFAYRSSLNALYAATTIAPRHNHLFEQRVKYFGLAASKQLFAAEFHILMSQQTLQLKNMPTQTQTLCELKGIQ